MPNYTKEKCEKFISVTDLSKIIGLGKRGIRKLIERGKIDSQYLQKESSKGRNGYRYLICPNGLPEAYRLQYFHHFEKNKVEEYHQDRTVLPRWAMRKATARLDIIHFLESEIQRAKKEGRNITPIYNETAKIYNGGQVLKQAFKILGPISGYRIQQRWWPAYKQARKHGGDVVFALAPKYNTRRGERSLPDWYKNRIKRILLHPNQISPTRGIKIVNANLRLQKRPVPTSIRTARRWVNDFKEEHYDQWVLMREGKKALNDKVLPYLDRDWNLLKVGQVLIADGHVLNFDVKHPWTGKPHRPTLICFYDGRSRMPVGLSVMPTENTDNISEALADAIRTLGKFPDAVILDNGRAFKAKHFTKTPEFYDTGLAGIYERYGILTHFTKAYHGQSKPIEPFFNQLNERFSKMLPTYRGNSIPNQVPRLKRNEKMHASAYKKQVGDWLPTIPEVVEALKHWSLQVYGKEPHGGLRKGETPLRVLTGGQGPGVPYHCMFDLLLRAKQIRPRRGRITIEGIEYQNWDVLTGRKKTVLVRYTRRVPDKVWVFDHTREGIEFMCVAQAFRAVHPLQKLTDEDGAFDPTIHERLKQRKQLEKRARIAAKELDTINQDTAEPVGRLIVEFDSETIKSLKPLTNNHTREPDDSDSELLEYYTIAEEEPQDSFFESAYERFEHIAAKEKAKITEEDIAFLKDFARSGTYSGLYKEKHSQWVNDIIH